MNHQKSGGMVTTGIPSIFLVFSVLCLVILSLMSLGTSRTDLQASQNSLAQTEKYYEACTLASGKLDAIRETLTELTDEEGSDLEGSDFSSLAAGILSEQTGVTRNEQTNVYTLILPCTQKLDLVVDFLVEEPQNPDASCLQILSWYTAQKGTWDPNLSQNLFLPGSGFP